MPRTSLGLVASVGFAALLYEASPALAQATAPDIAVERTYGLTSSTFVNTAPGTTINGTAGQPALCFDVAGAPASPAAVTGTTLSPCPAPVGIEQTAALATANGQACTVIGAGGLEGISIGGGPAGTFPPGCYVRAAALTITANGIVTLNGAGVYIFRSSGGALTTGANSVVNVAAGACENDVFWAPVGATTLGATTTFRGSILDAAGITIGQTTTVIGRALAFGGTVIVPLTPATITVPTCTAFGAGGGGIPTLPPTIAKSFSLTAIPAGGISRLTITLSNHNAAPVALTAAFTDTLPSGMLVAGVPELSTTCAGGTVSATGGSSTVTLVTGTIPSGSGSCTFSANVTVASAGTFTNTIPAGALQSTSGSNAAPFSATLTATATPVPTLSEWAFLMLMALLAAAGVVALRRRTWE